MLIKDTINYYLGRRYNIEYNYLTKVLRIRNKIYVYELPIIRGLIKELKIEVKDLRVEG